ncbi:hypothetical protein LQZ19_08550 [Treponema primitia]|uniref:hypothetical protein n=1 Tax=Treponema primitia TaxID=88058 RepID=UPI00397E9629
MRPPEKQTNAGGEHTRYWQSNGSQSYKAQAQKRRNGVTAHAQRERRGKDTGWAPLKKSHPDPWVGRQVRFFEGEIVKRCSKCGELKDESEFNKKSASKDGLTSHCKECASKYYQKYYEINRDNILKDMKEHYIDNPDIYAEKRNIRREKKNATAREKHRIYVEEHKDEIREKEILRLRKRLISLNKTISLYNGQCELKKTKEEKLETKSKGYKRCYAKNREKVIVRNAEYFKNNPEYYARWMAKKEFRKWGIKNPPEDLLEIKTAHILLVRRLRKAKKEAING